MVTLTGRRVSFQHKRNVQGLGAQQGAGSWAQNISLPSQPVVSLQNGKFHWKLQGRGAAAERAEPGGVGWGPHHPIGHGAPPPCRGLCRHSVQTVFVEPGPNRNFQSPPGWPGVWPWEGLGIVSARV